MEDSGIFAVVAENRGGGAKCSANLVVEEKRTGRSGLVPPSFLSTIQALNVPSGQLARFDAKLSGTQPLDVYWLKVIIMCATYLINFSLIEATTKN